MPKTSPCWLYLITDDAGYCKLGIAKHLESRLQGIQNGNPLRLRVHEAWLFWDKDQAFYFEQIALKASRFHHGYGEWRRTSPRALERLVEALIGSLGRHQFSWASDMRDVRVRDLGSAIAAGGGALVLRRATR